jgi:hypothetical protein
MNTLPYPPPTSIGESTMNRLVRMLFVLPALFGAAAALTAQDKLAESPYYPLHVGTTWHYKAGERNITIRVAKHEKVGETLCALLEVLRDEKVIASEHLAITSEGVYRHDQTSKGKDGKATTETLKPPFLVLRLPPKKGEKWQVDSQADGKPIRGTFQVAEEEVKVPAGTYKAFAVAGQDLEISGLRSSVTTYYASGVGMVKQVIQVGNTRTEFELTKFEAGK